MISKDKLPFIGLIVSSLLTLGSLVVVLQSPTPQLSTQAESETSQEPQSKFNIKPLLQETNLSQTPTLSRFETQPLPNHPSPSAESPVPQTYLDQTNPAVQRAFDAQLQTYLSCRTDFQYQNPKSLTQEEIISQCQRKARQTYFRLLKSD